MLDMKYGLTYAATSANLLNFLGHDAFDDHFRIFNATLENAERAHHDMLHFKCEELRIIDPFKVLDNMDKRNPFFVTFHTGSFNMLVSHLLRMGREVYVLSDTSSVANDDYNSAAAIYREKYKNNCSLEMINVELEGAIYKIIKKIRQGAIMVAYLDGNKGIGGQTKENDNLLDIDFLNGVVKVRKGVPFLSHITGAPLVLVLNHRIGEKNIIRFYEPIRSEARDKELACMSMMSQIFAHFEEHIRMFPEQWSNWPYVHKWADLHSFKKSTVFQPSDHAEGIESQSVTFNNKRFSPLKIGADYFLFDRQLYHVIPVKGDYIELFSKNTSAARRKAIFESLNKKENEIIGKLIDREVIIVE